MTDYHTHILPGLDDGPKTVEDSLAMLKEMAKQGVVRVIATGHFYPNEESPTEYLARREKAWKALEAGLKDCPGYPQVDLSAEVYYFPGLSHVGEIKSLTFSSGKSPSPLLLIEPPMTPWSERMLEEIASLPSMLGVQPVIAHVDRYMTALKDKTLPERLLQKGILVQFNAEFFIKKPRRALRYLSDGLVQFIGSDCHNLSTRPPNLGKAMKIIDRRLS